ncbi:MAG: 4-hydroxythreonine-4-phosphate dehydrogenase PdxA [Gammaproteobacteria bacterium]|jgi:4-hydroxythreonine-4-phosphate dehydrogenase
MTRLQPPKLVITSGEPAGIGPDLCVQLARYSLDAQLIVIASPELLTQRARQLDIPVTLNIIDSVDTDVPSQRPGALNVFPVELKAPAVAGALDPANAPYVLAMLDRATRACQQHDCHAMVTAPVHKGVINDAGIAFTGHTEYLAHLTNTELPVMMLETEGLRVALVTTHLPLRDVAQAITPFRLRQVLGILHHDLVNKYGIAQPAIMVCGLNPHAGEGGHLGDEEQRIIEPVLQALNDQGMQLMGPLPADTIFSPYNMEKADAFVAMYHDQGLPVLKYKGFGRAINVTLGLPIIRTSVDHGTALSLAGTGTADDSSFRLAIQSAINMASQQRLVHHG